MKKIIITLMAVMITVGLVGIGTYAYFSDTETSTVNTLTAGTLKLDVNGNGSTGTFNMVIGKIGNMAPGDITDWVTVTVYNTGSIDAATFGRFTLAGAGTPDLSGALNFYEYRAQYFKADASPIVGRWATKDPYFGTTANEDWFIKEGDASKFISIASGDPNLYNWVNGSGPEDVPGTAWDEEGVKAGGYYVLSFRLQMDPLAGNDYQGKTITVGYEVKATQLNTDAILALGLGGSLNDFNYVNDYVTGYLTSMISQYN